MAKMIPISLSFLRRVKSYVVFVHGLGGNQIETWHSGAKKTHPGPIG
jgi:hypothetical protein